MISLISDGIQAGGTVRIDRRELPNVRKQIKKNMKSEFLSKA